MSKTRLYDIRGGGSDEASHNVDDRLPRHIGGVETLLPQLLDCSVHMLKILSTTRAPRLTSVLGLGFRLTEILAQLNQRSNTAEAFVRLW